MTGAYLTKFGQQDPTVPPPPNFLKWVPPEHLYSVPLKRFENPGVDV
jgi:hypothetical protein